MLHKFYPRDRNVGLTHISLTSVGSVAFLAQPIVGDSDNVIVAHFVAWVANLFEYFYVRKIHFGNTMVGITGSGRLLL